MSFQFRTIAVACLLGLGITAIAVTLISRKDTEGAAGAPSGTSLPRCRSMMVRYGQAGRWMCQPRFGWER